MNKAQSLRLLNEWANEVRQNQAQAYGYPTSPASRVHSHGAAAVRAIRSRRIDETDAIRAVVDPWIVRESRLAFRAALNAVGLRGAL